jgi:hypothetical protein
MARESDLYSVSVTLLNTLTGGTAFIALAPIRNQVGVQFFMKGTGGTLEIAGGGFSQAPLGPTFSTINCGQLGISGVVPSLMPNGSGFPVYGITSPNSALTFFGQPTIWFSSGGTTSQIAVMYLKNSQDGG